MPHPARAGRWTVRSAAAQVWLVAAFAGALHAVLYTSERHLYDHASRRPALVAWWLATIGLFSVWMWVVRRCEESKPSRHFLFAVAGAPLVIQLSWLFASPVLSVDLYSYIADSLTIGVGLNPYLHAPREWGHTTAGLELIRYGWRPTHDVSPYGPLWMLLMAALGRAQLEVPLALLIVKAVLIACNALITVLILAILRETEPDAQLYGAMAFWWNPITLEAVGEGHNDALMVMAVLLAIWLTLRGHYASGVLALVCGVLTKYVPAVFAPTFLIYRWRADAHGRSRVVNLGASAIGGALLSLLLFAPFWAGRQTFAGLFAGMERKFTPGTSGALFAVLAQLAGADVARWLTQGLLGAVLVATIVITSRRVTGSCTLVRACAALSLTYVLVVSPKFWPWYVMLPAALLCALGTSRAVLLAGALTLSARLIAPLSVVHRVNAIDWPTYVWVCTVVGVWVPATWWVLSRYRLRSRVPA
jgi:Glycosyltransferase family 87